ncbi:germination protein YpeB [Clostridium formicaceticum]|uniref:Germination protein YpeB n=1 Tax=Clostridium formicaceticum TaxID=1497 RepID=A0AAC9RJE0_9CLOT|nr:germination protein YpeB [Clostridium formicaceticum]AOY76187.1 germination protein YpeB [Clostridium formicaceticum]ARE86560.1 Sporulation protein YpeB [Clostridium formicaceticum]
MRRYILPSILAVALVATGIWGYYQYNERNDYHTYLDIQFQRQFYDLIGHVENAQVDLAKAMVSGGSKDIVKHLNDTVFQSYMAQEKLTQLPLDHGAIRRTENFLNQLGDYCTAMVNKSLEGIILDEEEVNTLTELHSYANLLSQQLIELQQNIAAGGINFGDLRREGNRDLAQLSDRMEKFQLINFEERMQDYPELIYDGPFSEHLKDVQPRMKGETIDENQAIQVVQESFREESVRDIEVTGEIENTSIPAYYLRGTRNGNNGQDVSVAVSKTGGKVLWYLNPREIGESTLDREEAMKRAEEFLVNKGYENMVATYTTNYEGQSVMNFAYKQDDVIVYTDLIKVKVALDDGEIIGLETEGFLINHHERDIEEPEISEEEARERLSSGVEIENTRLAIIPTAGKKEILCYEFKVRFGEDHYLVYIDANKGEQRQVLLMIEQEDGTLVM